jgi:hypothetical protein
MRNKTAAIASPVKHNAFGIGNILGAGKAGLVFIRPPIASKYSLRPRNVTSGKPIAKIAGPRPPVTNRIMPIFLEFPQ